MPFLITYEDREFSTDDLTGREIVKLEEMLGVPWTRVRPKGEARHALYLLATFLVRDLGEQDVAKLLEAELLDKVTGKWLKQNVQWTDDDDLPGTFTDGVPDSPKDPSTGT